MVLHKLRQGFVGGELKCGERHGHGESRRVGDVECAESFVPEHGSRAVGNGAVCRPV